MASPLAMGNRGQHRTHRRLELTNRPPPATPNRYTNARNRTMNTATAREVPESTKAAVAFIKACGYRVFMRSPSDEHCFYTDADGKRIGYAQWSGYRTSVSSVHKANRTTGTGFQIAESITKDSLRDAIACHCPGWSYRDASTVKKYRDWDEYRAESRFNSELQEA
jgi:hypothetical protein